TREPRLFFSGAAGGIANDFGRSPVVSFAPGDRQLQHPRNRSLAENGIPENLVVHVATLGNEAGVLDVADDLDLVHAIAGTGGADDVFFDHHAAHVVRAIGQAQLTDLPALRDPGRL